MNPTDKKYKEYKLEPNKLEQEKMTREANLKKELMNHEFKLEMQIKDKELEAAGAKETIKEDRKDERTKMQASQQSELIEQRNSGTPPKKFESSGNDIMGGMGGIKL